MTRGLESCKHSLSFRSGMCRQMYTRVLRNGRATCNVIAIVNTTNIYMRSETVPACSLAACLNDHTDKTKDHQKRLTATPVADAFSKTCLPICAPLQVPDNNHESQFAVRLFACGWVGTSQGIISSATDRNFVQHQGAALPSPALTEVEAVRRAFVDA